MRSSLRVLVTGAAGFIGFHTARALASQAAVGLLVGVDSFNSHYDVALKRARQQQLQLHGVGIVEGDITNTTLLEQLFSSCRFTHVVHLAAQAGVRHAAKEPAAYLVDNVLGTLMLLDAIREQHPMPALVYASSASVYGAANVQQQQQQQQQQPSLLTSRCFSEQEPLPQQPLNLYGASKVWVEQLVQLYTRQYSLHAIGLRFFTVYGPWGRPDMAYYSMAAAVAAGRPITVYTHHREPPGESCSSSVAAVTARGSTAAGNSSPATQWSGALWRDFTYIDDTVAGILAAVKHLHPQPNCRIDEHVCAQQDSSNVHSLHAAAAHGSSPTPNALRHGSHAVFNLGTSQPQPVDRLVQLLEMHLGKSAHIVRQELPAAAPDMLYTCANASAAAAELGWVPAWNLSSGVASFIEWYKHHHGL